MLTLQEAYLVCMRLVGVTLDKMQPEERQKNEFAIKLKQRVDHCNHQLQLNRDENCLGGPDDSQNLELEEFLDKTIKGLKELLNQSITCQDTELL